MTSSKFDATFVPVTMHISAFEKSLAESYFDKLSPTVRYLLQKQLAAIVTELEFANMCEHYSETTIQRLKSYRIFYTSKDNKFLREVLST